jgi:hypothetical protein
MMVAKRGNEGKKIRMISGRKWDAKRFGLIAYIK